MFPLGIPAAEDPEHSERLAPRMSKSSGNTAADGPTCPIAPGWDAVAEYADHLEQTLSDATQDIRVCLGSAFRRARLHRTVRTLTGTAADLCRSYPMLTTIGVVAIGSVVVLSVAHASRRRP